MSRPRALAGLAGTLALALGGVSVGSLALVALPAPAAVAAQECDAPTARITTSSPTLGGTLTLTGTGWCHPEGTGSRIGVKIDDGAFARPNTEVHKNTTIWAIADARPDGTFTAEIPLPDGTAASSVPAMPVGEHTLRLLSGTLKPGDTVRNLATAPFTVTAPDDGGSQPPSYGHLTLASGTSTTWVEQQVGTGSGATVRLKGTGWTTGAGTGSTVAVKLTSSKAGGQYERSGAGVIQHPSASGDRTIWALIAPGDSTHPNVRTMDPDGTFEVTLDLPPGLVDGQYLKVSLTSGRFAAGDVTRSVTTRTLTVGTTAASEDDASAQKCTPTTSSPSVRVLTPTVPLGGTLKISGTGWCNPAGGGSRIGVKLDEGAIAHLDDAVHTNRTIWAVVQAAHADGTFTADLTLPDGTEATSTPALGNGSHTLRLLSGSLVPGDTIRSVLSDPFVIGTYRPNGLPLPFAAEDLTPAVRGDVRAQVSAGQLTLTATSGAPGDWVHLSTYLPDGSPRTPWADQWFRLDAQRRVQVTVPSDAPTGPVKVVVTQGNQESAGQLLGWAPATLRTAPKGTGPTTPQQPGNPGDGTTDPGDGDGKGPTGDGSHGGDGTGGNGGQPGGPSTGPSTPAGSTPATVTPAAVVGLLPTAVASPLATPRAPAPSFVSLGLLPDGGLRTEVRNDRLHVTFPDPVAGGDVVHVRVYGVDHVPAGWATLDAQRSLELDLADLPDGTYRFAFQDREGMLLGWTETRLPAADAIAPTTATDTTPAPSTPVVRASAGWSPGFFDGILLGIGAVALAVAALLRRPGRRPGGLA